MRLEGSPLSGRMIFVVGARRSGTYWTQRIVAAHPDVAAVPSETHLFSHGIAPLFDRFRHHHPDVPVVGRSYVDRDVLLEAARDFCDRVLEQHLVAGAEHLVERTPVHVLHLDLIASIYPDARFVHVIRDGRDVARSLLAQQWGPGRVTAAAREWARCVEAGRRTAPEGSLEVRYEELLGDLGAAVRRLYADLRLPATSEALERGEEAARTHVNRDPAGSPATAGKWRRELGRPRVRTFERVAGDVLDDLGYPRASSGWGVADLAPMLRSLAGSQRRRGRAGRRARTARQAGRVYAPTAAGGGQALETSGEDVSGMPSGRRSGGPK